MGLDGFHDVVLLVTVVVMAFRTRTRSNLTYLAGPRQGAHHDPAVNFSFAKYLPGPRSRKTARILNHRLQQLSTAVFDHLHSVACFCMLKPDECIFKLYDR